MVEPAAPQKVLVDSCPCCRMLWEGRAVCWGLWGQSLISSGATWCTVGPQATRIVCALVCAC
jgi:hypothetical protein